ncbi:cyclic lactone autoinducer peptide, partial [Vibrio parahaemolyticus]|nr:cyclic lactone autoinducer peptide [Vibrio parahaemolyticus]
CLFKKERVKKMLKKISSRKLKYMRILATVAIAAATEAIGKGTMCTGIIYEPKVPEALKQIEK